MYLFFCKILLLSFICVQYPDPQVKIHSFPTLLRSFTGPLTGAFEAGQASEDPSQRSRTQDTCPQCLDMATYEMDPEIGFDQDDPMYWRTLHFNLHHAILVKDMAEVKRLLSLGADINFKTQHGYNALDWADHLKNLEVAKCLLQNENIKLHGYVEILKHIRAKHPIIVRALLEMGVTSMLAKNKGFHRGLILQACRVGHPTILQMLINCVPGYMITDYKQVYLQVAASEHNDDALEILRERARQEEAWKENYFRPKTPVTPVQLPPRDLEYEKIFDEYINPDAYLP